MFERYPQLYRRVFRRDETEVVIGAPVFFFGISQTYYDLHVFLKRESRLLK